MNKYEQKIKNGERLTNRELSSYYNYKHPRVEIKYYGRGLANNLGRIVCDVSNYLMPGDFMVKHIVHEILDIDLKDDHDEKVDKIQKWVCQNLKYAYDSTISGYVEHWQFPFESIQLGYGDCEDGAFLITSLMLAAGIPRWRVRVAAGLVRTGNPTAPTGGHGWACYLRESDNKWVPVDWCYYPDMAPTAKKVTLKENRNYIDTWFSFNDRLSWGNKSVEFLSIKELV